jgi:hypothetical protein
MEAKGKRGLLPRNPDAFNDGESTSPGGSCGTETTKEKSSSKGNPRSTSEMSRARLKIEDRDISNLIGSTRGYGGATLIGFSSKESTMAAARRAPKSSAVAMPTGTATKEEATYTTESKYY